MKEFDAEALAEKMQAVEHRRANNKIFCYQCKGETHQKCLFENVVITPPFEIVAFDEHGRRKGSAWTIKDFRPFPTWATYLDRNYLELVCEIYQSLSAGSVRLPLMGARTLLDLFIVEKIGDAGTFKVKLQKLVDGNYISSSSKDLLEIVLEYGHAAVHRNYQANKDELNGALDIIENLLHTEALKDKTKDLKKNIPRG